MKRTTKTILLVSLAMIIFGGVLATLSLLFSGGDIGMEWNPRQGFSRAAFRHVGNQFEVKTVETKAFQRIKLETDYGNVALIPSDGYRVAYSLLEGDPPEISVENGELHVDNTSGFQRGWNILGTQWWGINLGGDKAYISVYYPSNVSLEQVEVRNSMGDLNAEGLSVTGLADFHASMGNMQLEHIQAGNMVLNADMGSVDGKDLNTGFLESDLAMGGLNLKNVTLTGADIQADMGSVTLNGDLSGELAIQCAMGSVNLQTSRPRSSFFLDVQADLGKVTVDGKKFRSGEEGFQDASNSMDIECDMGSIHLQFGTRPFGSERK